MGPNSNLEVMADDSNESHDSSDVATHHVDANRAQTPYSVLRNFVIMSILMSVNHGAMVSCMAFATLQLGSVGAYQSAVLHLTFAMSSLMGATYVVKQIGARYSMMIGMALFAAYVASFWMVLQFPRFLKPLAFLGAVWGGIGGGLVWTAQGSYFGRAAAIYASVMPTPIPTRTNGRTPEAPRDRMSHATSLLGGIFAFVYLTLEVVTKSLSWALLRSNHDSWNAVFCVYTFAALLSTMGMVAIKEYAPLPLPLQLHGDLTVWYKVTAVWQLFVSDPKTKWLVGLNAAFGFASSFVNSYINGEVVERVLSSTTPFSHTTIHGSFEYVGLFSALSSAVAAICCVIFGRVSQLTGKGPILIVGSINFGLVALPFLLFPDLNYWGWKMLVLVYFFQGVGRATFEGTLRATFADFFPHEKEGAFGNMVLQSGTFTALGYLLSFDQVMHCTEESAFCVKYKEGSLHNVLFIELVVVVSAFLAIFGYWKASILFREERDDDGLLSTDNVEEDSYETQRFIEHGPI